MDKPILSINVPTYNHENYIVQALDSILMQETSYSYEVLVGEDCSTDNTREVLREYEKQHPGKFRIFYREHNMNKEVPCNAIDLVLRSRGKYIIVLEGDDYWTDPHKIDYQIRFLEEHLEYIAVAHNCTIVDHNSNVKNELYPQCQDTEYTFHHYAQDILPGQLTTVMHRNVNIDDRYNTSLLYKGISPGDRVLYFWLLCNGRVHCIQETMSAYRHVTDRGSSYSATTEYRFVTYETLYGSLMEFAKAINHNEAFIAAQRMYFRNVLIGVKSRQCSFSDALRYFRKIKNKARVVLFYLFPKPQGSDSKKRKKCKGY